MAETRGESDYARTVDLLVRRGELSAERTIAWVRIALAGGLFVFFLLTSRRSGVGEAMISEFAIVARSGLFLLLISGLISLFLLRVGRFRDWTSWIFVTVDAVVLGRTLMISLERTELVGNYLALVPPIWTIPLLLAIGGLRYQPGVQIYFTGLLAAVFVYVAYHTDMVGVTGETSPPGIIRFTSMRTYALRLVLIIMTGGVIAIGMWRARNLLLAVVGEMTSKAALTRFLPAEIVPVVASDRFADLRRGRRQAAVMLFVDIRDFTRRAEAMDPHRLSIFVASFRRRVARAAAQYDGVIDKFVGDGAMIVFGLPEPADDDAARALACVDMIRELIARWNVKRAFDPPVEIGMGLHSGDVFCGVVGDSGRLEFTVLGDTVNVAARLEQATKTYHQPVLASRIVVEQACALGRWHEVGREALRGREGELVIMGLADASATARAPQPGLPAPSPSVSGSTA